MNKSKLQKVADYILDEHYLSSQKSLDDIALELYEERPMTLELKEDEWEQLNDTNSDELFKIAKLLQRNRNGRLNRAEGAAAIIELIPDDRSILYAGEEINKIVSDLFEKIEDAGDIKKGYAFEKVCEVALSFLWDSCSRVGESGDGGIDIICKSSSGIYEGLEITQVVQCKYYSERLDAPIVRKLLGDVMVHIFEDSNIAMPILPILITNNGFTKQANEIAATYGIKTLKFKKLIEELYSKGVMNKQELMDCLPL